MVIFGQSVNLETFIIIITLFIIGAIIISILILCYSFSIAIPFLTLFFLLCFSCFGIFFCFPILIVILVLICNDLAVCHCYCGYSVWCCVLH